jgi:UDP-glucuronate 4-epimerase
MMNEKYASTGRLSIFRGDICDLDFIGNVFEEGRPDYVCHLAARAGVRPSINDPYIYVHSNIEGTTRLLDLARLYRVRNFVYASSSSVYGSSGKEVLSEEDVVDKPVSPYAATKKACELLAYTFHHLYGLNVTGLRFFTVYGPRGRPDMAPYKFIERVYNGEPIQQYGDGNTSRDYTYISDIVDGVVRSIDRPMGYQVFNLGNGRPRLLKDFIALVEDCVGKKAIIEMLPEQPGDVSHTCADISKAQRDLGYNPCVPFEEGINLTSIWYMNACKEGLIIQPDAVLPPDLIAPAMRAISDDLEAAAEEQSASKGLRAKLIAIRQKLAGRLELDSNVQKARSQVTHRFERFLSEDKETEAILYERNSLEGLK